MVGLAGGFKSSSDFLNILNIPQSQAWKNSFFLSNGWEAAGSEKFLNFGKVKIEEIKFHRSKNVIYVNNVDIEKILISDKFAYGKNKEICKILHWI